jgi:hypothetical protein
MQEQAVDGLKPELVWGGRDDPVCHVEGVVSKKEDDHE